MEPRVKFVGKVGFNMNQTQKTVLVRAQQIKNYDEVPTGSISVQVWAVKEQTEGGFSGYPIAQMNLPPLGPHQLFKEINHELPIALPPPGTYQIGISIENDVNGTPVRTDYKSFNVVHDFHTQKISISGPCYYEIDAGKIALQITKISNGQSTATGPLKIELMAFQSEFTGEGEGFKLGEMQLKPLDTETYFNHLKKKLMFVNPPPGMYHLTLLLKQQVGTNEFQLEDFYNFPQRLHINR